MNKYPDDGGLKEPVRDFNDPSIASSVDIIKEHFAGPSLKAHIQGIARFEYYRDSALWYRTSDTNFLFPVPVQDIGTTTFEAEYKAIKLMRWIRMYMDENHDRT